MSFTIERIVVATNPKGERWTITDVAMVNGHEYMSLGAVDKSFRKWATGLKVYNKQVSHVFHELTSIRMDASARQIGISGVFSPGPVRRSDFKRFQERKKLIQRCDEMQDRCVDVTLPAFTSASGIAIESVACKMRASMDRKRDVQISLDTAVIGWLYERCRIADETPPPRTPRCAAHSPSAKGAYWHKQKSAFVAKRPRASSDMQVYKTFRPSSARQDVVDATGEQAGSWVHNAHVKDELEEEDEEKKDEDQERDGERGGDDDDEYDDGRIDCDTEDTGMESDGSDEPGHDMADGNDEAIVAA